MGGLAVGQLPESEVAMATFEVYFFVFVGIFIALHIGYKLGCIAEEIKAQTQTMKDIHFDNEDKQQAKELNRTHPDDRSGGGFNF